MQGRRLAPFATACKQERTAHSGRSVTLQIQICSIKKMYGFLTDPVIRSVFFPHGLYTQVDLPSVQVRDAVRGVSQAAVKAARRAIYDMVHEIGVRVRRELTDFLLWNVFQRIQNIFQSVNTVRPLAFLRFRHKNVWSSRKNLSCAL